MLGFAHTNLERFPFTPESTHSEGIPQEEAVLSPTKTALSQVPLQPSEDSEGYRG